MSISKIFIPNFVCVLTNERYKTYQTGFSFCRLGHAMSVSKIFIPNFVRVFANKRNYIEQNFYSVAGVMPEGWDLGVLGVVKNLSVGICGGAPSTAHSSLISIHKVNFKDFLYQTMCVFSQMKDTNHIRWYFHSVAWVMPQGWDFGAMGCPGGKKLFVFKHGHVAYQINGDDKQNRMKVKLSS